MWNTLDNQGINEDIKEFEEEQSPETLVFDVNGEKVGKVALWQEDADYFMVEKGWAFKQELYVPYNAIRSQDADGIHLSLSKGDLEHERWKAPPTGGA